MSDWFYSPSRSRVVGVILGAAAGDALGWPQENRSRIVGGKAAREVGPEAAYRSWVRAGGTRFAAYDDPVAAGEYSDDTQLMLAVGRACLQGDDWFRWLTTVELPQWPVYERGGGGAVLRAARAWARGIAPWLDTSGRGAGADRYFSAGGNGVSMRIAPHVVALSASGGRSRPELARRVVRDGIATHGHPRALLGAVVHAFALDYALGKAGTLEYGELVDALLDDALWRDATMLLDVADDAWLMGAFHSFGSAPEQLWRTTADEVMSGLSLARRELGKGALANDHEVLRDLGCLDPKVNGAGTVAAMSAIYVASRSASRPMSGLLRTAFLHGGDTDTIASMTGSLLGALHGPDWLGPLGEQVQDSAYLIALSDHLTHRPQRRSTDAGPVLTESGIKRWVTQLAGDEPPEALLDGRHIRVVSRQQLRPKGNSTITRTRCETADGQTLFVDRVTRASSPRSEPPIPGPQEALFDVPRRKTSTIVRMELRVRDLGRSRRFYGELLGLEVRARSTELDVGNGLVLTQRRSSREGHASSSFVLSVLSNELDQMARLAHEYGGRSSWGADHSSLWLEDPDGNAIRVTTEG